MQTLECQALECQATERGGRGRARSPSWLARILERAGAALTAMRTDLGGLARNRRVLHRLSTLSDRELKDIGLWRQDVYDAALIENGDAARFLTERRESRRAARNDFRRGRRSV